MIDFLIWKVKTYFSFSASKLELEHEAQAIKRRSDIAYDFSKDTAFFDIYTQSKDIKDGFILLKDSDFLLIIHFEKKLDELRTHLNYLESKYNLKEKISEICTSRNRINDIKCHEKSRTLEQNLGSSNKKIIIFDGPALSIKEIGTVAIYTNHRIDDFLGELERLCSGKGKLYHAIESKQDILTNYLACIDSASYFTYLFLNLGLTKEEMNDFHLGVAASLYDVHKHANEAFIEVLIYLFNNHSVNVATDYSTESNSAAFEFSSKSSTLLANHLYGVLEIEIDEDDYESVLERSIFEKLIDMKTASIIQTLSQSCTKL